MPKKTIQKKSVQAEAVITATYKHEDGTVEEQVKTEAVDTKFVQAVVNSPHKCVVGLAAGATIPTKAYANVRFDVSLSVPCEPNEIEDVYSFVYEWVGKKMDELVAETNEELDAKS